eukprot:scaffold48465_cov61-Phaeocystis_antarctica.AAC.3
MEQAWLAWLIECVLVELQDEVPVFDLVCRLREGRGGPGLDGEFEPGRLDNERLSMRVADVLLAKLERSPHPKLRGEELSDSVAARLPPPRHGLAVDLHHHLPKAALAAGDVEHRHALRRLGLLREGHELLLCLPLLLEDLGVGPGAGSALRGGGGGGNDARDARLILAELVGGHQSVDTALERSARLALAAAAAALAARRRAACQRAAARAARGELLRRVEGSRDAVLARGGSYLGAPASQARPRGSSTRARSSAHQVRGGAGPSCCRPHPQRSPCSPCTRPTRTARVVPPAADPTLSARLGDAGRQLSSGGRLCGAAVVLCGSLLTTAPRALGQLIEVELLARHLLVEPNAIPPIQVVARVRFER